MAMTREGVSYVRFNIMTRANGPDHGHFFREWMSGNITRLKRKPESALDPDEPPS